MRTGLKWGLVPALVMVVFGFSGAEAFVGKSNMPEGIGSAVSPDVRSHLQRWRPLYPGPAARLL